MLKTIKTTKELRLDELIKYVRENKETLFKEHVTTSFKTKNNKEVIFADNSNFVTGVRINIDDLFEAVIEEEITEDTKFHILVGIYFLEEIESYDSITFYNRSIDDVKDRDAECIYALIDNKLQLIWERE